MIRYVRTLPPIDPGATLGAARQVERAWVEAHPSREVRYAFILNEELRHLLDANLPVLARIEQEESYTEQASDVRTVIELHQKLRNIERQATERGCTEQAETAEHWIGVIRRTIMAGDDTTAELQSTENDPPGRATT